MTNPDWEVAGIGYFNNGFVADYNGDRRSDLLWHNQVTAESVIWWYGLYEGQEALVTVPDTNWKIIPQVKHPDRHRHRCRRTHRGLAPPA